MTRPLPPPPHDPAERTLLAEMDGWEVRDFAPDDPRHAYFAHRGFSHLQLWHPEAGISLLTPSRLTAGSYEVFPFVGWKRRGDYATLRALIKSAHGVTLPSPSLIAATLRWFAAPAPALPRDVAPPAA
jgi:hypothetical protein